MDYTRRIGIWKNSNKYLNSYDGGVTYIEQPKFTMLSSCSFNLSHDRTNSILLANHILSVASEVGGLSNTVFLILGFTALFVNERIMLSKLIRTMFYIQKPGLDVDLDTQQTFSAI